MRKFRWFSLTVVLAVVFSLFIGVAGAPSGAADDEVEAKPVRGQDVGGGKKLWVFVHPEHPGKPAGSTTPAYCTDGNQATAIPSFAGANTSGLTFNINRDSIPIDKVAATQAIVDSFAAWDNVSTEATYFAVSNTGGAARPADDGNNSVGFVRIVPKNVLAATWVWTDASNRITGTDVFYNAFHTWGVYTTCNAQSTYEVGDIGTHEIGHTVGLDHLSDPGAYATMYPSAAKGEVRKRTLTSGDADGYLAVGGY